MFRINLRNFVRFRKNRGWSKNELGRQAGVSGSQVSVIEKTGTTREDTAKKLADALGVTVQEIEVGSPNESPLPLIREEKPTCSLDIIGEIVREIARIKADLEVLRKKSKS